MSNFRCPELFGSSRRGEPFAFLHGLKHGGLGPPSSQLLLEVVLSEPHLNPAGDIGDVDQ